MTGPMRAHPRIPLTRRGLVLTGVVVVAMLLGWLFGARSLNAIVAPALVALVVAVWRVSRIDPPTLTRTAPSTGTRGERHRVDLTFAGSNERIGHVADAVDDAFEATGNERTVPLEEGLSYAITLADRGLHRLGPATVSIRDLLGLAARRVTLPDRSRVVVHPRVHPVSAPELHQLAEMANITLKRERHEFDRLREYQPEDSLRDIHWKTSAKRADTTFIVKEFVSERGRGSVMLSGESADGADDALAEAMASLASALIDNGVRVGLLTHRGKETPIRTVNQFDRLLTHLAMIGPGRPVTTAEIHLDARSDDLDEVLIEVNGEELTFGDLRRRDRAIPGVPAPEASSVASREVAD